MIPPEEMQSYGDRLLGYWHGRDEESGLAPPTPIVSQEDAARIRQKERQEREHREREKERERERERSRDRAKEEGRDKERKERAEREDRERREKELQQPPRSERQLSSAPMDVDESQSDVPRPVQNTFPTQNGIDHTGTGRTGAAPSPAPAGVAGVTK